MAIYAILSGTGARIAVEVGDIRPILTGTGWRSTLARRIDGGVARRADLVVATAEGFLAGYYAGEGVSPRRALVIENRIDCSTWQAFGEEWWHTIESPGLPFSQTGVLTIGYFGLLRCPQTWTVLRDWAGRDPRRHRLVVRGYPGVGGPSEQEMKSSPGVDYGGPFTWPEDLSDLYGSVDLVCASYPVGSSNHGNWRWAKTNRFYEACMFRRPLLVLEGSADAEAVLRWDIGAALPFGDGVAAVRQLDELTAERVGRWHQNLQRLPREVFLETDEARCLRLALETVG
jgi:succinoglycan biosynthesis protein ExoL